VPYLQEIRRVLRPGGVAILTTPNAAIRLDPGMTPWNRFHVREYRAAELEVSLGEVFDGVEVLGMFGVPTLDDLEIERVDANRRGVRARQAALAAKEAAAAAKAAAAAAPPAPKAPAPTPSFGRRVKRRLGRTSAVRWARGALGRTPTAAAPPPPAPAPAPQPTAAPEPVAAPVVDFAAYTVADLFYSGRDLDRAMDLMAICTVAG